MSKNEDVNTEQEVNTIEREGLPLQLVLSMVLGFSLIFFSLVFLLFYEKTFEPDEDLIAAQTEFLDSKDYITDSEFVEVLSKPKQNSFLDFIAVYKYYGLVDGNVEEINVETVEVNGNFKYSVVE